MEAFVVVPEEGGERVVGVRIAARVSSVSLRHFFTNHTYRSPT